MTPAQFRAGVIDPAVNALAVDAAPDREAAEELLLGTGLQESGLHDIAQIGGGPALGPFQMERATHDDIWKNFLAYRPVLAARVRALCAPDAPSAEAMMARPLYACAMARIKYLRAPAPLPQAGDISAQAAYWKRFYNTADGAGSADEYVANWNARIDEV